MLKLAGVVLDIHDDISLSLLRTIVPPDEVEKLAAEVELLSPDELAAIEDSRFGAIFYDTDLSSTRRAFPLHTPGHAKLSAAYFQNCAAGRVFPDDVQNQIAAQIGHGHEVHAIPLPEPIAKMAERHGEWSPGDNFIDMRIHDAPAAPEAERYALSKTAGATEQFLFPCETKAETEASIQEILSPHAMEDLGIAPLERREAASALKFAAESFGVAVPDALDQLACVEPRGMDDLKAVLESRIERYVDAEKRAAKRPQIKVAMEIVLDEKDPSALVNKIALLDAACGIGEHAYHRRCPRPFDVVFVPGAKKEASDAEVLASVGGLERVTKLLGDGAAKSFEKNAKKALSAQPAEIRSILLNA